MSLLQQGLSTARQILGSGELEQLHIKASDFISQRSGNESGATRIEQMDVLLDEAAELLNRNLQLRDSRGQVANVISPVVIPRDPRSKLWIVVTIILVVIGLIGWLLSVIIDTISFGLTNLTLVLFGPHYWLIILGYVVYSLWRNSFVMVPDGCQALITRFGKLEEIAPAGRKVLLDPWKRVSYIVNITREYPYNAPIREAPTASRVNASVDLFLQFKIEDPAAFIFTLGGAKGFQEKLQNAVSEVTRALIYEQRAEAIYDLVGESTQNLLNTLNQQFLPAVRFVNANITHAEPSSQEYRIDLAKPEMIRVAKEAYTYEYQLALRKEQDEGDLNRELTSLREQLSAIQAEIATYQAQIDTAREKEIYRANAYASQLLSEAESAARANAALLEAQALDIRAVGAARYPEILQYRYQQDILDRLEAVADHLPQIVQVSGSDEAVIDYLALAQRMLGITDTQLYSPEDVAAIRRRTQEIRQRILERDEQIRLVVAGETDRAETKGDNR
jgi:regulator of protease activity HflC (stomatin/prohibitin superfamily)